MLELRGADGVGEWIARQTGGTDEAEEAGSVPAAGAPPGEIVELPLELTRLAAELRQLLGEE